MDNPDLNDEEARKFLEIATKHTNRLNAIIDDLLQLSKIEQDFEKGAIALNIGKIQPAIQNAIRYCDKFNLFSRP